MRPNCCTNEIRVIIITPLIQNKNNARGFHKFKQQKKGGESFLVLVSL